MDGVDRVDDPDAAAEAAPTARGEPLGRVAVAGKPSRRSAVPGRESATRRVAPSPRSLLSPPAHVRGAGVSESVVTSPRPAPVFSLKRR